MQLNSLSTVGIATQVWSQATRNLTGFGSAALTMGHAENQTLAASATATFTNPGSTFQITSVGAHTTAGTGTVNWKINDGTRDYNVTAVGAGLDLVAQFYITGSTTIGKLINNDATNSLSYCFSSARFVQ